MNISQSRPRAYQAWHVVSHSNSGLQHEGRNFALTTQNRVVVARDMWSLPCTFSSILLLVSSRTSTGKGKNPRGGSKAWEQWGQGTIEKDENTHLIIIKVFTYLKHPIHGWGEGKRKKETQGIQKIKKKINVYPSFHVIRPPPSVGIFTLFWIFYPH